jgi:hypothetical protein
MRGVCHPYGRADDFTQYSQVAGISCGNRNRRLTFPYAEFVFLLFLLTLKQPSFDGLSGEPGSRGALAHTLPTGAGANTGRRGLGWNAPGCSSGQALDPPFFF